MRTPPRKTKTPKHNIWVWILALCALCAPALAATVTNTTDADPGSLRWAIANTPSGETIEFDRSIWGATIRLSSQLAIDSTTLTIQALTAADMAISGEKRCRVFHITDSNVTLKGLTIENGHDNSSGAGIRSSGDLTMRDCTVRNCVLDTRNSTSSSYRCRGAGIYAGTADGHALLLENCTITSNLTVMGAPGYPYESAGTGMFAFGSDLTIRNSVFSNNVTLNQDRSSARIKGVGAAFRHTSGTLQNCLFRNNTAVGIADDVDTNVWGNGLSVWYVGYTGGAQSFTIRQCRFTGNRTNIASDSGDLGSVIHINYINGPIALENCLIDDNLGRAIVGIPHDNLYDADLLLRNTTITGNTTDQDLVYLASGFHDVHFTHCTIANNTLPEGRNTLSISGSPTLEANVITNNVSGDAVELYGRVHTNGYNIVDSYDASTITIVLDGPGDQIGIDPMLGPLADNGGPTLTMMPLPGSPLIDAIPSTATFIAYDQRCAPRPCGSGSEIGACETGTAWNVRFQRDQAVAIVTDEPTWTAVWDYAAGQWTANLETALPATLTYPLSVNDLTGLYLYNLAAGAYHESIHNWHQVW